MGCLGSPGGSVVRIHLPVQEIWVWSLGWGNALEKEMVTTAVFLPGKLHERRSLLGYSLWGNKRVGRDLATKEQQIGCLNYLVIVALFSNTFCTVNWTLDFFMTKISKTCRKKCPVITYIFTTKTEQNTHTYMIFWMTHFKINCK